jgi:hypothetical protein
MRTSFRRCYNAGTNQNGPAAAQEATGREIGMWIFRCATLRPAGATGITSTMFWNEIRDHIRERLPAIVDFILFGMALTIIAVVLLGLTWLYVEYGMAALLARGRVTLRHRPLVWAPRAYLAEDDSRLWDDKPSLPPPGKRVPPPGTPQIGRASRALTPSRQDLSRADRGR